MDALYKLLEKHRLERFFKTLLELGVKDERDLLDSITHENLIDLGFSQVERTRFASMQKTIRRFRAPVETTATPVQKCMKSFSLKYTYPKCPEAKCISDMDPAQNTVEDLMLRICHAEHVDKASGVCLYTVDGMPLTDDPFFNTWSLQDRHIKDGDEIYAIFTPKQNLPTPLPNTVQKVTETHGDDTVRCHVMLKGDFEVTVNLVSETILNLRNKLSIESGIPAHVLHYRGHTGDTLASCGISDDSTVFFSLSSFPEEVIPSSEVFEDDVLPSVQQTPKGMSCLLSSLYIIKQRLAVDLIKKCISYIRKLSGCSPLGQSLYQLLCKNLTLSRTQKVALVEGLYTLFREILPDLSTTQGGKSIEDLDVLEYSTYCWAYLLSESKKESSEFEDYAPYSLRNEDNKQFCEPVTVPGVPGALERSLVVQKLKDGEKIPNCSEQVLREISLKKDTVIEKMLLSLHPSVTTYYYWIAHDSVTHQNFQITTERTFGSMAEDLKASPLLNISPPLRLKVVGLQDPCLVYLSEDNLGVYLRKDKEKPEMIVFYDCLSGKETIKDVNELANVTGDHRNDQTFVTSRTPKEAILVLIDASSSMSEICYEDLQMQKINAVKELFDNFASRTMAYDFYHILFYLFYLFIQFISDIIGLMKFDSTVKIIHTFTETLEKFKEHVRTLEPSGQTKLYDALQLGKLELDKVKIEFPDCRLRIVCLTDGNDIGSSNKPTDVAANLIKSNIIVDSILLGKVVNTDLYCISNATGGCCFKPQTSKMGLRLFEHETVLSLELRKLKSKAHPLKIREYFLQKSSLSPVYEEVAEVVLPSQINNKVNATQDALKRKIQEAKGGRFVEKDKRILEELKNVHCDPHPFFNIYPSESDFTFWKLLMEGPPDTPYEKGVFELFCQFGSDYPVKPPMIRFITPIYHCNINNAGRICHNIFDRNYNAQITMRDILDAIFGLLISPEPEDPLDSILAEEYMSNREGYQEEAKRHTEQNAGEALDAKEKQLVEPESVPNHLVCQLTKKMFVEPVKTKNGMIYERKAIEKHLTRSEYDPFLKPPTLLRTTDLKPHNEMKKMVKDHRSIQILGTPV